MDISADDVLCVSSSTWRSRWTSSGRSTTSMLKCTSSWTCRPESWSRATANWFWTTGRPSRRSRGKTREVDHLFQMKMHSLFGLEHPTTWLWFLCSGWWKRWSCSRRRWRSCSVRWRSWSWLLRTERSGHLEALGVCAAWRSCRTHSGEDTEVLNVYHELVLDCQMWGFDL